MLNLSPIKPPNFAIAFRSKLVAVLCEFQGSMVWIESTTLCKHPCAILGYPIDGCQAHLPEDRIRDYITTGGHVDLYRLSPIEKLSESESKLLTAILVRHFIGQRVTYDLGGALVSGTRLFKRTRLLPQADLNELFCSELVAAVCMRLGRMNRSNPTRFNPACLLRELVRQGTFQFEREFPALPQRTQSVFPSWRLSQNLIVGIHVTDHTIVDVEGLPIHDATAQ
ncbi:hypothetical protein [Thalassoglobus sp.]|uniref:hypothetical protein n=1 Tax=Thalassoglobus sp. TaxID=2795869 RepID=UPI003AA8AEBD